MQYDHVPKKMKFDLLMWGGFGQNICYHVAALAIPFNLIINMVFFLKKLNFNLLTPRVGGAGGRRGGLQAFFCYHVAAPVIPFYLMCNMAMF